MSGGGGPPLHGSGEDHPVTCSAVGSGSDNSLEGPRLSARNTGRGPEPPESIKGEPVRPGGGDSRTQWDEHPEALRTTTVTTVASVGDDQSTISRLWLGHLTMRAPLARAYRRSHDHMISDSATHLPNIDIVGQSRVVAAVANYW